MYGILTNRLTNIIEAKAFINRMKKLDINVKINIEVGTNYRANYTSFNVENLSEILGKKVYVTYWDTESKPHDEVITKKHIERITVLATFNENN